MPLVFLRRWKGSAYRFAALSIGYYVIAWVAQLSAIPPDYAVPVWPGSGIALAGLILFGKRYWPAILVAGFAANLSLYIDLDEGATLASTFLCSVGMASGAALQAVFGAWLIQRYSRFPHQVDRYQDLLSMVALGGPFACLISAAIGPVFLAIQGAIEWSEYLSNAVVWWVGDTLGVLLVLPPVSAWASELRDASLRTRIAVTVPPAILATLTFVLYIGINHGEMQTVRQSFAERARSIHLALARHVNHQVQVVEGLAAYVGRQPNLTQEQFSTHTREVVDLHEGLIMLGWAPRVSRGERGAFEARLRGNAAEAILIWEHHPEEGRRVAPGRDHYTPLEVLEPLAGNTTYLGLDCDANPVWQAALEHAARSGTTVATPPVRLAEDEGPLGVILFTPLLDAEGSPGADDGIRGFVVGFFELQDLLDAALYSYSLDNLHLALTDIDGTRRTDLLGYPAQSDSRSSRSHSLAERLKLGWSGQFFVAGRTWQVDLIPRVEQVTAMRSNQPETVLISGLLLTAMLGTILLVLAGRNAVTERLVAARTAELRHEIDERRRIQQEREALIMRLESALSEIRQLHGLLPICASCKKIRDDAGSWTHIEAYISARAEVNFTHGICPECTERLYPEFRFKGE